MPEKAVLYRDVDGTTYEVGLPLTSNVDLAAIRDELGIPSYVDLNYFPMESALVTIWAAVHAPELHEKFPEAFRKRVSKKPIAALLFGGAAVKIHCESANGKSPLSRRIKDTDFIVPKKQGRDFYNMLLEMNKALGTRYTYFRAKSDRLFNALRHGDRYRIRTIKNVTSDGVPVVGVIDILCDKIDLRHKLEVKDEFNNFRGNLYTIGLENLILSKTQFITDLPKTKVPKLMEYGQEFRILPYNHYREDMVIIGMEEKDVRDLCAIFLDHEIGEGDEEINPGKMLRVLKRDKKFALTTRLNLQNLVDKPEVLKKWLTSGVSKVVDGIKAVLEAIPRVDKKWNKPWWNTAVETPIIE